MINETVKSILQEAAGKTGIQAEVVVDVPAQKGFGDFATSIALKSAGLLKKAPRAIAEEIVKNIPSSPLIEKVEIIGPGFINVWVNPKEFLGSVNQAAKEEFSFPAHHLGPHKKVMVEFAHPNTHKLFHIGHMRNISTGETVVRLLEAVGNKVIRTNYQGDVGLHIAKCLYAIRKDKVDLKSLKTLQEKIKLLGAAYARGQQDYEAVPGAKDEIHNINKMIYEENPEIVPLWKETVAWSLEYFAGIYKRVGSTFDRLYFESETYKRGIEIVKDLLAKGLLKKSEGAVVFEGKPYGVDTRVFLNSLGFPTYEGKELALAEKEFSDWGELDRDIHVVTPEQTSFFQTTFKVEELIDPAKYKGRQYHLAYNWVQLKSGKMSSRTGNVIEGMWLVDEAKRILTEKFPALPADTAETLAVGAVKYSFLKVSTAMEIAFDFEDSISLEGNSAPYLNYTFVRTRSVLEKDSAAQAFSPDVAMNEEDRKLAKKLYLFPLAVHEAAAKLSPNLLTNYLFELAQDFNLFYQKNPILKAEGDVRGLRLALTRATGATIRKGLSLLGIETVNKM